MQDIFHSQFQPRLHKYIDNNNYVRNNIYTIIRKVIWVFTDSTRFLNMHQGPMWEGDQRYKSVKVAYDPHNEASTNVVYDYQLLYGSFFFLSDEVHQNTSVLFDITDLSSLFGGLISFLIVAFGFLNR